MGRLAPPLGQVAPGRGAITPVVIGKDAPVNRPILVYHEYCRIENLAFHLQLNYILYLLAAVDQEFWEIPARTLALESGAVSSCGEGSGSE